MQTLGQMQFIQSSLYISLSFLRCKRARVRGCVYTPPLKIENAGKRSRAPAALRDRPAVQVQPPMASLASVPGGRTDGGRRAWRRTEPEPEGGRRRVDCGCAGTARASRRPAALPPGRSGRVPAVPAVPAGLKDMGGRCARAWRMIPSGRMVQSSTPRARARASARACKGMRGTPGRPSENLCHAPRPFAVGTPYATPRPRTPFLRESPAEKYKFRENRVPLLLSVLACAIMSASWRRWHQR